MTMLRMIGRGAVLGLLLGTLLIWGGCESGADVGTRGDGGQQPKGDADEKGHKVDKVDMSSPKCQVSTYEAQIIAFCKQQHPPPPAAGEIGASCADRDSQCKSNICLHPYGSIGSYCTIACPNGDECPTGFSCQDSGSSGPMCYEGVCVYGGKDKVDCVTKLSTEAQHACMFGCGAKFAAWIQCLLDAGRVCSGDQACGIERGLLESCCTLCDSQGL